MVIDLSNLPFSNPQCFFIKVHISRSSRRRDATCQVRPQRKRASNTLGPIRAAHGAQLSYYPHGYRTTSRRAKDPDSGRREQSCPLARRACFLILRSRIIPVELGSKAVSALQVRAWSKIVCSLLEGSAGGCVVVHWCAVQRHATTRSLRLEARHLLHAISPHIQASFSSRVCLSSAQYQCQAVTFRFCSLHVEFQLVADRQSCVRGCRRIITLGTPLAVLYKQIYSPLHGPRGGTPRVCKAHYIIWQRGKPFASLTLPIIAIIAATNF